MNRKIYHYSANMKKYIKIVDMDDKHLINTINYIWKHRNITYIKYACACFIPMLKEYRIRGLDNIFIDGHICEIDFVKRALK